MKVRILANGKYTIAAIMDGEECPVYDQLSVGIAPQYRRFGIALLRKLKLVSKSGFDLFPSLLSHEISKEHKIYEFIQGKLRLVYFHGLNEMIVVCTEVFVKKTQNTKSNVVYRAVKIRDSYISAINNNELYEVMEDEYGIEQIVRSSLGQSQRK